MASAPNAAQLPVFYNDLVPLNREQHKNFRARPMTDASFMAKQHAIPLTVEEFPQAQRHFPIIFSVGDNPVPLALMGLNEGINIFMDEAGKMKQPVYIPAYVRRYPFMLAKITPDAQQLSLCFDPTSEVIGEYDEGDALFDGDQPSEAVSGILKFCEQFEQAGARTGNFLGELKKYDLLMDGEVSIQQQGREQPFVYRGFQMVNEEKLRELRGDELRKMNQSGMLPLIYAHLFSLDLMRNIFSQQVADGKVPQVSEAPTVPQPANG